MADRELLELAAKAAGFTLANQMIESGWNPLTDDGDALRLAVKLGISLVFLYSQLEGNFKRGVSARHMAIDCEEWSADIGASTRLAIVLAAAELGKGMT